MKRKALVIMLSMMLTASAFMTGCGGDSASSNTTASTEKAAEDTEAAAEDAEAEAEAAEGEAEAAEEETEAADTSWADYLTSFYMGITDDENTYAYVALNDDNSFGGVMFYDVSSNESGSWVGECTDNGDGTLTVSDESNGTTLTFSVEMVDDAYLLDMGDIGQALVGECSKDEFVAAAEAIDAGSAPQF